MSTTYMSAELRRLVQSRADAVYGCHVDHIGTAKHDGLTHESNPANDCTFCNLLKRSETIPAAPLARVPCTLGCSACYTSQYGDRQHRRHSQGPAVLPAAGAGG